MLLILMRESGKMILAILFIGVVFLWINIPVWEVRKEAEIKYNYIRSFRSKIVFLIMYFFMMLLLIIVLVYEIITKTQPVILWILIIATVIISNFGRMKSIKSIIEDYKKKDTKIIKPYNIQLTKESSPGRGLRYNLYLIAYVSCSKKIKFQIDYILYKQLNNMSIGEKANSTIEYFYRTKIIYKINDVIV